VRVQVCAGRPLRRFQSVEGHVDDGIKGSALIHFRTRKCDHNIFSGMVSDSGGQPVRPLDHLNSTLDTALLTIRVKRSIPAPRTGQNNRQCTLAD